MSDRSKFEQLRLRAMLSCSALVLAAALADAAAAQTVVNPVQSTTFVLSTSPITFGGGTNITTPSGYNAVYGSAAAWVVTNQGVLDGGPGSGIWIDGGSLSLTNTGQISGQEEGVVTSTGTPALITNQAGGAISAPKGDAITINSGGWITNQAGATISSLDAAIQFSPTDTTYSNTITNAGVISTTTDIPGWGAISLTPDGAVSAASIVNQSGGLIQSNSLGIYVAGGGPTYSNNLITVTNASGATITAFGTAISAITNPVSITNAGTITTSPSSTDSALNLESGGAVTNTGVINGAVYMGVGSSTVDTSGGGQIKGDVIFSGANNRLVSDLGTGADPIQGVTGQIVGGSNSTLQLNVTSDTTLASQPALPSGFTTLVYGVGGGATLTVDPSATLTSVVNLTVLPGAGAFVNNGTISTTGAAIAPSGLSFNGSVNVTNNGAITATLTGGGYAIAQGIYGLGSITNAGTITATGGGGVSTTMYGALVLNSGTITADQTALDSFDGIVTNSGTIHSNSGVGVYLLGNVGMPATNTSTGVIYGKTIGAELDGYILTNSGTITSPGMAVQTDYYGSFTNLAGGVVNGNVGVSGSADTWDTLIQNAGTINGNVNFGYGGYYGDASSLVNQSGGVVNGTVSIGGGAITNAGLISGGLQSVVFLGGANTLTLQTGSTLVGDAVGSTAAGAVNALILQGTGEADNNFLNFTTLDMQGSGPWTLGGASTIGAATVSSGTLVVTGTLTSPVTIAPGATLALGNGGTTGAVVGAITDNGLLQFDYSGQVSVANSLTGTGSAEVVAGDVVMAPGVGATFLGGTVTIDKGATLEWGDGTSPGVLAGAGGGVVDNGQLVANLGAGQTVQGAFAVSGSGGLRVESGTFGTSAASAFTGATTIDTGAALALSGAGSIANSSGVTANGTLDISGTTSGAAITTLSGSGAIALGAQTLTLTNASGTFSGAIADGGAGGSLVLAAGTETLTGTNTYTGSTLIGAGATLALGNGGTTGSVAGAITDNGLLQFDYSGQVSVANSLTGTGSAEVVAGDVVMAPGVGLTVLGGTVTIDQGATLEWGDGTSPGVLAGAGGGVVDNGQLVANLGAGQTVQGAFAVSGSGGLRVESGTFGTSAASAFTGATTIDTGAALALSGAGSIANSSGVTANGTLDISGTSAGAAITTLSGSGAIALGAQTLTLTNASGTFSGVIADGGLYGGTGGSLVLAAGTETLTGANTFTGRTLIGAGATLQLGDGRATGSVAGAITDNGTLVVDQSADGAFDQAITGSGALVKQGGGTLTLGGASSLGSTTVSGGALVVTGSLASAFAIDSGATLRGSTSTLLVQGDVTDNGALVFDQAADGEFDNAVTGSGALVKLNAGALTLGGASSVGSATVSGGSLIVTGSLAGALSIDSGANLQGSTSTLLAQGGVTDNGTLVFDQASDGTFANAVTGSGALVKQNAGTLNLSGTSQLGSATVAGGTLVLTGPLSGAFTVDAGATLKGSTSTLLAQGALTDNGTVVFDQAADGTFSNAVTGSGALVKQNTGALVLNGVSSVTTTTVNGGVLEIGDQAHAGAQLTSSVTVNAGATLAGHGTIIGKVTNNGGVVSPGGSIGVLTIKGDFTQSAGGTLSIQANQTQSSQLVVTGTATLAGALQIVAAPGIYRKGTTFDLLNAGSVSGDFSSVTATNGMQVSASVQGGELAATVTQGVMPLAAGVTANQRTVASAFIDYPAGTSDFDPVANALIGLGTSATQNAAFDRLGGEVYADLLTAGRDSARGFLGALSDQLSAAPEGADAGRTTVWGRAFGRFGSTDADGNAHGYSGDAGGAMFGAERGFGAGTVLGASLAYGRADIALKGLAQTGELDTGAVAVYGAHSFGAVFVDGAVSYDYDHGQGDRTIALPGVDRKASSGFSGSAVGGMVEAGVQLDRAGFQWRPSVGLLYSPVRQDGFTESGAGGADLAIGSQSLNAAESLAGVRFSRTVGTRGGGTWRFDGRLAWAHELGDVNPTIGESFAAAPGTGFTLAGARLPTDSGLLGAGLSYQRARNLSFYVRYDGVLGRQQTQNAVSLGARFAW